MHKLERDANPPVCLTKYRHGRDQWGPQIPTREERAQIWEKLDAMQAGRCAYCEARLSENNRKIEHFRQRASHRYPQGTFEWSNLFGACTRANTCDGHKDQYGKYDHRDLIKPDEEDPEQYLVFNASGEVRPRLALDHAALRRAQATIDILNLNERSLVASRRSALFKHEKTATEYADIARNSDPETQQYIAEELAKEWQAVASAPYATAIKHLLLG